MKVDKSAKRSDIEVISIYQNAERSGTEAMPTDKKETAGYISAEASNIEVISNDTHSKWFDRREK